MSEQGHSTDTLVVGGGLAGVSAAIALARDGQRVTLLERESTPRHKVCGEFLSAEALAMLSRLGLDVGAMPGTKTGIDTVRLASTSGKVSEARLPFAAASITRHDLDSVMLGMAAAAGVRVLRGKQVRKLSYGRGCWLAEIEGGLEAVAPHAIHATGKHDLRGFERPQGTQNDLVALKMYFQLQPEQERALERSVELLLHPAGYTGLQRVANGVANLTALVGRVHLRKLGGWEGLLNEIRSTNVLAANRLRSAVPLLPKALAISSLPYGYVRAHAAAFGLWSVGDQCAVIPSFTGDGMSIALYTGLRAAEGILRGESAEDFHVAVHDLLAGQVARATALSRALARPFAGNLLATFADWWPAGLTRAAALTRLPEEALAALNIPGPAPEIARGVAA